MTPSKEQNRMASSYWFVELTWRLDFFLFIWSQYGLPYQSRLPLAVNCRHSELVWPFAEVLRDSVRHIGCGSSLLWYHVYCSHVSMGKTLQSGAKLPPLVFWWWKRYLVLMGQSWGDPPPQQILFQSFSLLSAPSSPCVTLGPGCFALFGSLQVSENDSGSMISISPGARPSSCLLFCCLH